MRNAPKPIASLAVAVSLGLYGGACLSMVTYEDQKLMEAAGCDEIVKEYRNFSAAEKKLAEEIRQASNSTTAGNVLGVVWLPESGTEHIRMIRSTSCAGLELARDPLSVWRIAKRQCR